MSRIGSPLESGGAVASPADFPIVTEIGLTVVTNLLGLAFAVALARWILTADAGSAGLRRLDGAVRRAVDVQLWRSFRSAGAVAAVGLSVALAGSGLRLFGSAPAPSLANSLLTALGFAVGVVMACLTAQIGAQLARAGTVRAVAAARRDTGSAITVLLRSTGAAALFASTTAVLANLGLFVLAFAIEGGFSSTGDAARAASRGALLVAPTAFGSGAAALLIERTGSVYRAAAAVATEIAGEATGAIGHDDARNPALIAELVGSHLGRTAVRVLDLHVAVAVAGAIQAQLGVAIHAATGSVGLALLPVVVHAFAAIASVVGLLVVRVGPRETATVAPFRSLAATVAVATGGLAAASLWLVGEHWLRLFASGLAALAALLIASRIASVHHRTRAGRAREIGPGSRASAVPALAAGVGIGLESTVIPVAVAGLGLVVSWHLGQSTGIADGGVIALATATALLLSAAPFTLALSAFDPSASDARGVLALTHDDDTDATSSRVRELDEAGFAAGHLAQPYLVLLGAVVAVGAAWALGGSHGEPTRVTAFTASVVLPGVVWSGALGGVMVLARIGGAARATGRGAVELSAEIDRQLRRFPRERGVAQIPTDFTPSYRACTDLAATVAARGAWPTALALIVPLLVAIVALVAGWADPSAAGQRLPTQALTALSLVGTVTGLGAALTATGASVLLLGPRRAPRRPASWEESTSTPSALGEVMATTVGPTAMLLVKVVAVAALVLVPALG